MIAKIQMVDLKSQYRRLKVEFDEAIQNVLDEAYFINGPQVKAFTSGLSAYLGGCSVIPCANGTDALQIALMALDLEEAGFCHPHTMMPSHNHCAAAPVRSERAKLISPSYGSSHNPSR